MLLAVQSLKVREISSHLARLQSRCEPVCDTSLVHKLKALIDSQSAPIMPNPEKVNLPQRLG